MEQSYNNNMYGSGDFIQIKSKVHCSICHGEHHTMDRHKGGPKRNPRMHGATGRNHRSGTTDIIEVSHM
jgi:hypothetical protein